MISGIELVNSILPPRKAESHKGNYGSVLVVAGSVGFTGAAHFAAESAVRGGAGLVFLGVPRSVYPILALKTDSAMAFPLEDTPSGIISDRATDAVFQKLSKANALVLGCGLGRSPEASKAVFELVEKAQVPVVLDADGINAFEGNIDKLCGRDLVLTPHEGELARLGFWRSSGECRAEAAVRAAKQFNATVVFKGPGTAVAAPDGRLFVNTTGNPGMARGGSGDILAGLVGAFIAQGADSFSAAGAAVYIHGVAGDMAREQKGEVGMTPADMLDMIPLALKNTLGR
ncbi:MAG: NAD(P)H-hydrate dehydratase [Clostridia bacterium]|nr:NAD(P)H-hydrate dehydratase [Clostridia bacterium]